jgi:hypothetical protein
MIRADYLKPEIFQGQFIEDTNTNQNLVMSVFSKRLENFEKHVPTCLCNGFGGHLQWKFASSGFGQWECNLFHQIENFTNS